MTRRKSTPTLYAIQPTYATIHETMRLAVVESGYVAQPQEPHGKAWRPPAQQSVALQATRVWKPSLLPRKCTPTFQ
jgi:hypothetical protein